MGADDSKKTVAVLQPGYLPWLGFFDQMRRADVFVYYDDVQFDKHGWRNRNRIKTAEGPRWLTVPVRHHGQGQPLILETKIDNTSGWARKHVATLRQSYAKAPFSPQYLPAIESVLAETWTHILDLDLALAALMAGWLEVAPEIWRASQLGVGGGQSDRLVNLCLRFNAGRYLSGSAARNYLDVGLFERHGIEVIWQDFRHPVYPQQHGSFVPFLSALDLLFNCGEASAGILASGR